MESTGSAFVLRVDDIGKSDGYDKDYIIVTNAHVAADAAYLELRRAGDDKRYAAQCLVCNDEIDLAFLKLTSSADEVNFLDGVTPLALGRTPGVQDTVRALGFPMGGEQMAVTKGVVSRVELIEPAHSPGSSLLGLDMDCSIAPGNSGGPVVQVRDNEVQVIGVAFQKMMLMKEGGFVITAAVLRKALETYLQSGAAYSPPSPGFRHHTLENTAQRRLLGLPQDSRNGVRVRELSPISPLVKDIECTSSKEVESVKVGDILLAIAEDTSVPIESSVDDRKKMSGQNDPAFDHERQYNVFEVSGDASVELRPRERTSFGMVWRRRTVGEKLDFYFYRPSDSKTKSATGSGVAAGVFYWARARLTKSYDDLFHCLVMQKNRRPEYVYFGGLTFTSLTRNFIEPNQQNMVMSIMNGNMPDDSL